MHTLPATDAIAKAREHRSRPREPIRRAADWFHNCEGELVAREDILEVLATYLRLGTGFHPAETDGEGADPDLDLGLANRVVTELVEDLVDPVVQVRADDGRYVGVVEYVEGDFWYGYERYDDVRDQHKRAVCAQCVAEKDVDREIVRADEGFGSIPDGATWSDLEDALREHFDENHPDVDPSTVETGASLLSGTTIAGNTSWHAGNDGSGSGLNADVWQGAAYDDKLDRRDVRTFDGGNDILEVAILDGTYGGGIRVNVLGGFDRGESLLYEIDFMAGAGNTTDVWHQKTGTESSGSETAELSVTEDANGNRRVYFHEPNFGNGKIITEYYDIDGVSWTQVADRTGTEVYTTQDGGKKSATVRSRMTQELESKILNGAVYGAHPDFGTAQAAIDWASNNGYSAVVFPPGTYGGIVVPGRMYVGGYAAATKAGSNVIFDGGTSQDGIRLDSNGAVIDNVAGATTQGGGSGYEAIFIPSNAQVAHVRNCGVVESDSHGIYVDGIKCVVSNIVGSKTGAIDGDDLHFGGNSDSCVLDTATGMSSITNNGAGNVIGETAN